MEDMTALEASCSRNLSLSVRLQSQITDLGDKAAHLRRAKEILDKNPELKELLDILSQAGMCY